MYEGEQDRSKQTEGKKRGEQRTVRNEIE